jgi:hypothetical protein
LARSEQGIRAADEITTTKRNTTNKVEKGMAKAEIMERKMSKCQTYYHQGN